MKALDDWIAAAMRKHAIRTEAKIVAFLARTKLPLSEVTLVHFKGCDFPQWKGAVQLLMKPADFVPTLYGSGIVPTDAKGQLLRYPSQIDR